LLSEHLPLGLDILSEIMWDPALRPGDVDAERSVILDEILMHADEPADLVAEQWQSSLFSGHPLGRDTLGTQATVGALGADDIRHFFEHHYRPGNMVVSVAGDCTHARVAADLEDRFAGQPGGAAPARRAPGAEADRLHVVRRPTEQAHLVYGVRSVSRFDERRWALAVLNHVLGGGLSSRLFQKIREERGLAYSVWSERAAYQDAGSLAVVVGTAPDHVDEVLRIVSGELELLAEHGITDRELAVAKGNLRAEMLLSGEDSGARMGRIGASMLLHGEVPTIDEVLAHLDSVGRDEVLAQAHELVEAPRTLSAVGPFDEEVFADHVASLAGR
jgi:predicted Zn-dependent peptidase